MLLAHWLKTALTYFGNCRRHGIDCSVLFSAAEPFDHNFHAFPMEADIFDGDVLDQPMKSFYLLRSIFITVVHSFILNERVTPICMSSFSQMTLSSAFT